MKRNYKYFLGLFPGVLVIVGNLFGGWWVASNFIFSFVFLAVLEFVFPENKNNSVDEDTSYADSILYLHVLMQIACLSSVFYSVFNYDFQWEQLVLMAISTGINTGASAIVTAHELIHRKKKLHQWLGKFLLFTSCNFYFFVDHLKVHHKWVGTPRDHATARYGENVYAFFIRSVAGQINESIKMESVRLKKANPLVFLLTNYVVVSIGLTILSCYTLFHFFGSAAVLVFLLQSFVGNFLLEYTNYIEHYGLSRKENERVTELHSWQSDKVISRYFLIDLSRHSDHHYQANKPFYTLKSYENAPKLPGGYVNMIYFALFPPLWFKVMHRRLEKLKVNSSYEKLADKVPITVN